MLLYIRRKEVTVVTMVTMVSMRQTILRILHTMPIYRPIHILIFPCYTLLFGRIPPVPNFAKIHARGPRGRLRIAPRDLIPPPPVRTPAVQAICPWLPSAPTHTQAHIAMRPCGRPAAARHNSRQQLERSATLTAPASQQHVIRSSFLPTSASVLRTFGTSGHFAVLPKEQPHRATRANVAPNSPKSCQAKRS